MRDNVIAIMPFFNIDSFIYINENYQRKGDGDKVLMIRKNRNVKAPCSETSGGVDLNRNFDMEFGKDDIGSSSNPCEEDYRGEKAFSEPET